MSAPRPTSPPGPRDARFIRCIDTGRWLHRQPEQLVVAVVEHRGTMLLGVYRQVRQWTGYSAAGLRKPDLFRTIPGEFYYNLADPEQLDCLFATIRHIAAFSAGLERHPNRDPYWMKIGDRKVLTETPLRLWSNDSDTNLWDPVERVEIRCDNRNYRPAGNEYFAWNPEIREAYRTEYHKRTRPTPRLTFRIKRRFIDDITGHTSRGYTTLGNATVSIPAECGLKFCEAIQELIQYVWSYLVRHPEQSDIRYLPWKSRWQLHNLPTLRGMIPMLRDAALLEEEPALFIHPELYLPTPRLQPGADDSTPLLNRFTDRYLERLFAYGRGELKWKHQWDVHELQAKEDLEEITNETRRQHYILAKTYLGCMILLIALVRRSKTPTYATLLTPQPADQRFTKPPVRGFSGLGRAPPPYFR